MAVYKLNSNKKNKKNTKKVVGFSLLAAASVVFLFLTGIVSPIQTFLLGLLGVFGYPLCIILFVVGLALVNNRKYVMSLKYTICLCLSVFFALCILQLAIVGNKGDLSFGEYLAKNYLDKWTAGGIIIGLFTTSVLYIANIYGAYIIFALCFVLCVALLLDSLNFLKREKKTSEPVSLQIKDKKSKQERQKEEVVEMEPEVQNTNVVLDGNLKEEEEKQEQKPLTARQILGLDRKRNTAYEYETKNKFEQKTKEEEDKPKSLKEYILTPPEIDIDEYFKNVRKQNDVPSQEEISDNISSLKNDEVEPSQVYHEDEFKAEVTPVIHRTLPEVKSEELVERADDILRSAIQEEKSENPDIYDNFSPLDNLPERDNGGNFTRRDSFEGQSSSERNSFLREQNDESRNSYETRNFERSERSDRHFDRTYNSSAEAYKQSLREREERNLSQDDKDARGQFAREQERMNMRNGTYARETNPIPEEEPEHHEPYIYEKPSIDMITTQSVDLSTLSEDVAVKRVLLENTLETFGVPAKVHGVVVGPAVTRYELEMPQGISVQKIKNRADDIALSLAAEGTIRIEAPIPGKSVVGIEVPNTSIATVSLKDVLSSREFMQGSSPLTFALGKDIAGKIITADMTKLTHLLVAGSTGSGKSVCLNSIILSIIYKASPEDVKILLVDPKRVEFAPYEGLPHLIMPQIVSDTQKAINALTWAVNEMERRFDALGRARVREISEYNQSPEVLSGKLQKMPYIVIIVDELADLMMTGKKEVEEKVCRLAQKARAAGIHLILATQRPSTDVFSGLIKANFPSRISFAVASAVDSMVILDRVGAEKLLGRGDMFYFPNGAKDPMRVQGCFISGHEINSIVDFVKDNNPPIFDEEIEKQINNPNKNNNSNSPGYNTEMDELLPQALKVSIDCGQASATMIRRKFAIGYPRAARIIDQMEAAGYISSADGAKGRSVYITEDEFRDIFGDQYD